MKERIGPRIPRKALLFGNAALAIAAACSGGKGEVPQTPAVTPLPTPTPEATVRPQPSPEATPTPTERPTPTPTATPEATPFVPKTILDQPVTPVTIEEMRTILNDLYNSSPKAFTQRDGSIYPKQNLDAALNICEKGDPNSPELRIDQQRATGCQGIVRLMNAFYQQNRVDELWQIAVAARNYYIGQYPRLQPSFDAFLRQAGVN